MSRRSAGIRTFPLFQMRSSVGSRRPRSGRSWMPQQDSTRCSFTLPVIRDCVLANSSVCESKTKSGRRNVFIDSVTIQLLHSFLAGRRTGRLFQSRSGTPLENRDICRRVLKPICEKLGIEPGGMHAFRHGRVSHMQASMMPGDFVKNQIGHSSLRITSNYTHFEHGQKREMVEKLLSCTQSGDLYTIANHAKAS